MQGESAVEKTTAKEKWGNSKLAAAQEAWEAKSVSWSGSLQVSRERSAGKIKKEENLSYYLAF